LLLNQLRYLVLTADKATLSLFKYKSTEVGYWFCLEETEKNNSEYFHNGSKIDNYNWSPM